MEIWVPRPSGNRIGGMRIAEIAPADVGLWLPRAIEHMARVRVASGALREGRLVEYKTRKAAMFRVGVPRDSRIFTSETGEWMWLRPGDEPEVVASRITGDPAPWVRKIFAACDDRPVGMKVFPGERGLAELPSREISERLAVPISDVHLTSTYDDIHVRSMTAAELDTFLERTMRSAGRHLALASGSCPMRGSWDVLMKARERLSDGVATPGHALMAICVDSTTIGGMWVEIDGKDARIWDLHVYEGYRGHGHSKAALLAMAEGLKREGVHYLNVTVMAPNTGAIDIYESVGFRVTARHVVLELPTLAGIVEL